MRDLRTSSRHPGPFPSAVSRGFSKAARPLSSGRRGSERGRRRTAARRALRPDAGEATARARFSPESRGLFPLRYAVPEGRSRGPTDCREPEVAKRVVSLDPSIELSAVVDAEASETVLVRHPPPDYDGRRFPALQLGEDRGFVLPREIARKKELVSHRVRAAGKVVQDLGFGKDDQAVSLARFASNDGSETGDLLCGLRASRQHAVGSGDRNSLVREVLKRTAGERKEDESSDRGQEAIS